MLAVLHELPHRNAEYLKMKPRGKLGNPAPQFGADFQLLQPAG
jgi:hypothetical protein